MRSAVLDQTERSGITKDSGVVSAIGASRSPTAAMAHRPVPLCQHQPGLPVDATPDRVKNSKCFEFRANTNSAVRSMRPLGDLDFC